MRLPFSAQLRSGGRLLLLAVAIAALATACAQLARADDALPPGGVTIAPSASGAEVRSLAAVDIVGLQDVNDAVYTVRAADGTASTATVAAGTSVAALLHAAGLDDDPYTFVEIAGEGGSIALLQRDDIGGTDEGPPVVWSDGRGVHFLRPSKGAQDANAGELVTVADGPLALTLRSGAFVKPQIAVSTLRGRPRQRIEFRASLAAGTLLPGMRYQWYFDGSGTVVGANVSHRFPRAGSWSVLLNVVRGQDTVGLPARVDVRVAPPRREQRPENGGDSEGDDVGRSGGGGAGGGGAGQGTGGAGGGLGGTGAAGTGSLPDDLAPTTPVAPTPPIPSPPRSVVPRTTHEAAPPRPQGELVSGTLIASTQAVPTFAGDARAGSPSRGAAADGPLQIPVGVWMGIGLVALLALGWTLESRHTLPFWQP